MSTKSAPLPLLGFLGKINVTLAEYSTIPLAFFGALSRSGIFSEGRNSPVTRPSHSTNSPALKVPKLCFEAISSRVTFASAETGRPMAMVEIEIVSAAADKRRRRIMELRTGDASATIHSARAGRDQTCGRSHAATALLRRINGCEIPVWKT